MKYRKEGMECLLLLTKEKENKKFNTVSSYFFQETNWTSFVFIIFDVLQGSAEKFLGWSRHSHGTKLALFFNIVSPCSPHTSSIGVAVLESHW